MAVSIDNVYIQTFERNLRHLAQQGDAKLRNFVTERAVGGEKHNWERLAAGAATQKTTALTTTPAQELVWSRRVSVAQTWHAGEAVEQEDIVQLLIDPKANVTDNLAMSMRRAVDDLIIDAGDGSALDGDGNSVAYTAGQTVGDGTGEISFDMVTEVQELFLTNDIDPDMPKVFVVGPKQVRKLMMLTEQTSSDYVQAQALQTLSSSGIVPNWMGFTWIMSNRLNAPGAGELNLQAFTPRAIGLQINRDISARVAEDPSVSFAWRLYCFMTMGAVRVEDEHHVKIHVADTVNGA